MNVSRSLTMLSTPATVVLSVVAVVVAAGICFAAVRRSGYRPAYAGLEFLRFSIVCIAVVLFNQPEWVEEFRPEGKPSVAVLWDASRSMDTCDIVRPGGTKSAPVSRREAIAPLTDPSSWSSVAGRFEIGIQSFSAAPAAQGTNLYDPLADAPDKFHNLRAIVIASDGDWNAGKPPVQAADLLRQKGIPIFAVTVGSPTRLPDVDVLSLDAPTFGVVGKSVRVPFTIESSLPREYVTTVTLRTSSGDELSKEVHIAPMGRTSDWIVWKPKATGDFTVTLDVPPNADETLVDNNRRTAPISIREEKLKVLVVESYPRWEYRYLRNALSRDPGVEVSCLLFHPGLSKPGGGNKDYIKQFPAQTRRAFQVRRRLSRRRRRWRRPTHGRAVPFDQRTRRAAGKRPGLHARLARPRVLAFGDRTWRPVSGRARPGTAQRLGSADAQPFRADGSRPSQPAHKVGRFGGR